MHQIVFLILLATGLQFNAQASQAAKVRSSQKRKYDDQASSSSTTSCVDCLYHESQKQEFLEQYDASLNKPLLDAADKGNLEAVQDLILNKKANPHAVDTYGRTPLFYAIVGGNIEIVRFLLTIPAVISNINKASLEDTFIYTYRPHRQCLCTPLMKAVDRGDDTIVAMLLKVKGIDVNHKNGSNTALIQAFEGLDRCVRFEHNINYPLYSTSEEVRRNTQRRLQYVAIIQMLLNMENIDTNIPDEEGITALMVAVEDCETTAEMGLIQLLIDKGADVNATDPDGVTPFDYSRACDGTMAILLRNGAIISEDDYKLFVQHISQLREAIKEYETKIATQIQENTPLVLDVSYLVAKYASNSFNLTETTSNTSSSDEQVPAEQTTLSSTNVIGTMASSAATSSRIRPLDDDDMTSSTPS